MGKQGIITSFIYLSILLLGGLHGLQMQENTSFSAPSGLTLRQSQVEVAHGEDPDESLLVLSSSRFRKTTICPEGASMHYPCNCVLYAGHKKTFPDFPERSRSRSLLCVFRI